MQPSPLPSSLRNATVFARLSPPEIDEILGIATGARFEPGEHIITAGDPSDCWYVLASGQVAVTLTRPRSDDTDIACLGPGAIFGEMGVLLSERRTADVVVIEPTQVLRVGNDAFSALLDRGSVAAFKLVREMAQTLARRQRDALHSLSGVLDDEMDVPREVAAPVKASVLERLFDSARRAAEVMPVTEIPGSSSILELPRFLHNPIGFLRDRHERYGPVFRTRLNAPCVVVSGSDALDVMHVTQREKFSVARSYEGTATQEALASTFLLADGEENRRARAVLGPLITRLSSGTALDTITAVWTRCGRRLAETPAADAFAAAREVAYEIAARLLIGVDADDELSTLRPLIDDLGIGVIHPFAVRIPFGRVTRALRAGAELRARLIPLAEQGLHTPRPGLLGLLAQHHDVDGRAFAPELIADWIVALLCVGFDTTAAADAWVFCKLAQHPDWQERLLAEQHAVCGQARPSAGTLHHLTQQEWFLTELQRMYPGRLLVPRKVIADVVLGGFRVPAGTLVYYSPYLAHRLPESFDEPDLFAPERWDLAGPHRHQAQGKLFTFGAGERVCLGKPLALLEQQLLITTLLPAYRLQLAGDSTVESQGLPVHCPVGGAIVLRPR